MTNDNSKDKLLIIFAKNPEPGKTKTRLIQVMGKNGATKLSKRLLLFTLEKFQYYNKVLYCSPDTQGYTFQKIHTDWKIPLLNQIGKDLGEKMQNAITEGLTNHDKVILIGTDCPDLSQADIDIAFNLLDNHDTIISPAFDGGYVLIGARKKTPSIFSDINWGTDSVMNQTINKLVNYKLLEPRKDFDRPEDIQYFKTNFPFLFT